MNDNDDDDDDDANDADYGGKAKATRSKRSNDTKTPNARLTIEDALAVFASAAAAVTAAQSARDAVIQAVAELDNDETESVANN